LRESLLEHSPLAEEQIHAMPVEEADIGCVELLAALEGFEVVGQPGSVRQALTGIEAAALEAVSLDISLPDLKPSSASCPIGASRWWT
jgi:hypothetical protein